MLLRVYCRKMEDNFADTENTKTRLKKFLFEIWIFRHFGTFLKIFINFKIIQNIYYCIGINIFKKAKYIWRSKLNRFENKISQIERIKIKHQNKNNIYKVKEFGIVIEIGLNLIPLAVDLLVKEIRKTYHGKESILISDNFFLDGNEYCIFMHNNYKIINEYIFTYNNELSNKYNIDNYDDIVAFAKNISRYLKYFTCSKNKNSFKRRYIYMHHRPLR